MRRHREFSFTDADEHFRRGMRETFPPLMNVPSELRAALLGLEQAGGQPATPQERHDAIVSLAEDERLDAQAASRTVI